MRLISLNVWKGKLRDELIAFICREAPATDIFCFQEMVSAVADGGDADLFRIVKKALPDFEGFFESAEDYPDGTQMGLAMFIRRADAVDREGDVFVYRSRDAMVGGDGRTLGKNLQFAELPGRDNELIVANFHGLWSGTDRDDNDPRLSQSRNVRTTLDALRGTRIICGDFNLTLKTQSLAIIKGDMRNLIEEAGIASTRPLRYFPYPDRYCDYIFVDEALAVKKFAVMDDEVSDHLPLILEFEI